MLIAWAIRAVWPARFQYLEFLRCIRPGPGVWSAVLSAVTAEVGPGSRDFRLVSLLLTLGRSAWLTLTVGLALLLFLMPKKVLLAVAIPGFIVVLAFSLARLVRRMI